jgi:hypothetical protein
LGALDPVGENLVDARRGVARDQTRGLLRTETRYDTGARYELLNETNRDEVQRDLLGGWRRQYKRNRRLQCATQRRGTTIGEPSRGDGRWSEPALWVDSRWS